MPLAGEPPSFVFAPELGPAGSRLVLSREEGHYLARVCRARVGDPVTATDGRGALARLRLASLGRDAEAEVEFVERAERERRAWVLCGAPEGERADWLIEKLAEFGVAAFQPIDCARGRWVRAAGRAGRWRRLAIAGLRQSRRRFLLELREPAEFESVVAAIPADATRWLADPLGRRPGSAGPEEGLSVGVIGPAGGWSGPERVVLEGAGFEPICLADGRLRAETAALAWAAWWSLGAA